MYDKMIGKGEVRRTGSGRKRPVVDRVVCETVIAKGVQLVDVFEHQAVPAAVLHAELHRSSGARADLVILVAHKRLACKQRQSEKERERQREREEGRGLP